MKQSFNIEYFISIAGIIGVLIGIGFFSWMKILKETNTLLKTQNDELQTSIKLLQTNYDTLQCELKSLSTSISVLKDIPLVEIRNALVNLVASNATTLEINSKILHRLMLDSRLLTKGNAVLVKASKKVASDLKVHDDEIRKVGG